MKYVRYVERNDNEGETWIRWLKETDPLLSVLKEYLSRISLEAEGFDPDAYELETYEDGELVLYDEAYVKATLDESDYHDGYFDAYRVVAINSKFSLDWIKDGDPAEQLYKLQHFVNI
ncbi:hypothetical protein MYOV011v1_p0384 [Vibrio phage 6E35.1a]|nr:hypothetical protein MYOV011v1_p0384 [Vibrio phage 6E35.1a]